MSTQTFRRSLLAVVVAATATTAQADTFNRIASFATPANLPADKDQNTETSAEIITASDDGKLVIYSDSPLGGIGFVNIEDAASPKAAGFVALHGEPTSVATAGNYIMAGVNTSESYTQPSGFLAAVELNGQKVVRKCNLGGQPDSVAVSKDGKFVAVAIENERDEDLNDGELPQLPAGYVAILPMQAGLPVCAEMKRVEMTGLAEIGATDPEPEFVDFNDQNEIVVTLQENNHLAIINATTGEIINHFSAGSVELTGIDVEKDYAFDLSGSQIRLREPDAVKWLDNDRFVIANEGDYKGGARGFTIFNKKGEVLFESYASFEHEVIKTGHYPEKRSGKKGNEPEGLAVGKFGGETYIFVLSERANLIGVYRDTGAAPEFVQMLPSGIGPESAVTIPSRGLLVSANEKDLIEDKGPRAHVMLYQLGKGAAQYPQIRSGLNEAKLPIGWGALSGLAADATVPGKLYAVNDSFYKGQPSIYTIDATKSPALISHSMVVTRGGKPAQKLDLEGIALDRKGGFWLASEGKTKKQIPHAIHHVNAAGEIIETLDFPETLLKYETRFGAEGITLIGDTLWIAIQRQWKDDPENTVKLVAYNTKTKEWGAVRYPTEAPKTGWVGLSEITAHGDSVYLIERDNQIGDKVVYKRLYKVSQSELKPAALGSELPVVKKEMVLDFIPALQAQKGYVTDKIEGFTIDAAGVGYAVTDNDGVDDSSGETFFFTTGKM